MSKTAINSLLLGHGQLGCAFESLRCCIDGLHIFSVKRSNFPGYSSDPIARLMVDMLPNVIINTAAYTDVAGAELAPAQAMRVNGDAVARLAEVAKQHNALLVHFSTDYLFDGSGHRPWQESDRPAPLNAYGQSKWAGEQAIIASGCRYLIIRTSWLHSPWRDN